MITHIVLWRIQEQAAGLTQSQAIAKIRAGLEALPARIPELRSLVVGVNALPAEQASDLALVTTFDDWKALEAYQVHPDHQAVAALIRQVVRERRVIDFES